MAGKFSISMKPVAGGLLPPDRARTMRRTVTGIRFLIERNGNAWSRTFRWSTIPFRNLLPNRYIWLDGKMAKVQALRHPNSRAYAAVKSRERLSAAHDDPVHPVPPRVPKAAAIVTRNVCHRRSAEADRSGDYGNTSCLYLTDLHSISPNLGSKGDSFLSARFGRTIITLCTQLRKIPNNSG